jgi:hypothetical protein
MALALIYPEPAKGGRGKTNPSEAKGFSQARLNAAHYVLRHSRDLAQSVIKGAVSLDGALFWAACPRSPRASTSSRRTASNTGTSPPAAACQGLARGPCQCGFREPVERAGGGFKHACACPT